MYSGILVVLAQTPSPAAKPVETGLQGMNMMVWMAFAFALIYFMSIRPQAKRAKEQAARVNALKTGDRVVTTGGIYGFVSNVKDGSVLTLKIADNVKIEIDKTAIAGIINAETGKTEVVAASAKR